MLFTSVREEGEETTLLSSIGHALLPFLSTRDATAFRASCVEARDAVAAYPFNSLALDCNICGSTRSWRACFPSARAAVLQHKHLHEGDIAALHGVLSIDMYSAELHGGAAANLRPLSCVVDLDVSHVVTLKPSAFNYLHRVRSLRMAWCRQRALSAAAFEHLSSLVSLDMTLCWQEELGDESLAHLARHGRLKELRCGGCTQATLTDEGVAHLLAHAPLEVLDVSGCRQLTDAVFAETLARFAAGGSARPRLARVDVSFCPRVTRACRDALTAFGVAVTKRASEREREVVEEGGV